MYFFFSRECMKNSSEIANFCSNFHEYAEISIVELLIYSWLRKFFCVGKYLGYVPMMRRPRKTLVIERIEP